MSTEPDDLDKLLSDVRKTISENKLFLDKLVDESDGENLEDGSEAVTTEEDFEEL